MQPSRILAIAPAWAFALLGLPIAAPAQTIDTSAARATVGVPLNLVLRVRDFEPGPASLGRDCLQAEVQQGDATKPAQPLRWLGSARAGEGETWIRLSSTEPVEEPLLRIKVALLCGAPFVREFTLLAEPPSSVAQTAPSVNRRTQVVRPSQPTAPLSSTVPHADLAPGPASTPSLSAKPAASAPPSASPLTDAFVQLWQQDMQALREEQRQARATLVGMNARLERSERETWQLWSGLAALGAGLALAAMLWRVAREVALRRFGGIGERVVMPLPSPAKTTSAVAPQPMTAQPDVAAARPEPPAHPTPTSATAQQPRLETTEQAQALAWDDGPAENPPSASRWAQSDFGQPALDETRHAELLAKVDAITAGGYFGASVAVLENALQSRVGKSPGILLRLLDLYRQLNQPWNHERVSAEIEAIYNVSVPAISDPGEGCSLEEQPRSWQEVMQSWGSDEAAAQLARLLVRPTWIEVLDLAAFRDALLLHTVSAARSTSASAVPSPEFTMPDTDALPALSWSVQAEAT